MMGSAFSKALPGVALLLLCASLNADVDLPELPRGLSELPRGLSELPRGLSELPRGLPELPRGLSELPRGKGEMCVEPTEYMRKYHFDLLTHQRDLTVRSGIRTPRHSLTGCIDCHVQQDAHGQFIAVDAPGQFCESCHGFVAVKLDCFECHAAKPALPAGHALPDSASAQAGFQLEAGQAW